MRRAGTSRRAARHALTMRSQPVARATSRCLRTRARQAEFDYARDASVPVATTYAEACFVPSGCVCR